MKAVKLPNFTKIFTKSKKNMTNRLDTFSQIMKETIKDNTPEKTRKLIGNIEEWQTIDNGRKIHKKIYNNTPYAKYVEYWVWKIFNYHKGWQVFYRWDGAGMFARSKKQLEWKFKKITD